MGDGNPIIFLHGWGLTHESFYNFSKGLKEYKCLFVDLYGFGNSKAYGSLTLQDYADGIAKIIEDENLLNVTLVGHSFGGRIALLLASSNIRIKGLVLIDSAGLKPRITLKKVLLKTNYRLRKLLKMSTNNCGSKDYRVLSLEMKNTFKNIVNYHLDRQLKYINQDCLIVWGKKDKETPLYMAHRLNRGIKNSAIVLLDGGHFAYAENSSKFILILRAYLDGLY